MRTQRNLPVAQEVAQLLAPSVILAKAAPASPIMCGIYFLIRDGRITYVGQSMHVMARIASHMAFKQFDSWAWTPCASHDLNALERAYIDALAPEENSDSRTRRLRWEAESLERADEVVARAPLPPWPVDLTALAEVDNSEAEAEYTALCDKMESLRAMRRKVARLSRIASLPENAPHTDRDTCFPRSSSDNPRR